MAHSCRWRFALILVWLVGDPVSAGDWPRWRGPDRNGRVAEDSGWDSRAWPPNQPEWTANVGEGASSPLVIDGLVYTMGWNEGHDVICCREAGTGKERWRVSYECKSHARLATGDEGAYSGATSTPEYDGDTGSLYTLSCDGDLYCWNTREEGRKIWGLNLYALYDVPRRPRHGRQGLRDYGYTTAPLVSGDVVIVEVGDEEGNLMAFSKRTGERLWASEYGGPAGHSGGLVAMKVAGVPCVAVLAYAGLHVARLDAPQPGKTVALYPWGTDFANNIATPAVHGDDVLITSAYNHNAICRVHVTLQGATKVWEQPFASKVCSPVIHRGRVYWAWQQLHCLDFETGRQLWEGGEFGDPGSCLVTADDRLIVWGHRGRLALVDTADRSPTEYRELARLDHLFATEAWPHVVLADGRLFCKDRQGNLKCFSLRPRKE